MTAHVPEAYGNIGPWQRYVEREHAARDAYLAVVQSAHREYLTGPWPDREAYQHVEQSAWMTYYAAGREAWRYYARELAVPARQHPYPDPGTLTRDAAGEIWPDDDRPRVTPGPAAQQAANQWAASNGYPPVFPTFTEHERSDG